MFILPYANWTNQYNKACGYSDYFELFAAQL